MKQSYENPTMKEDILVESIITTSPTTTTTVTGDNDQKYDPNWSELE